MWVPGESNSGLQSLQQALLPNPAITRPRLRQLGTQVCSPKGTEESPGCSFGMQSGAVPDPTVLALQDLHPQEAPGAVRRGGVAGSAGQAVPRSEGAGRAAFAPEPQRGAPGAPPSVHARQRRAAPSRRAAAAEGSLAAGRPHRPGGPSQVCGARGDSGGHLPLLGKPGPETWTGALREDKDMRHVHSLSPGFRSSE